MNERDLRDRLHALGPMVLRLGIAAVLIMGGLDRAFSGAGSEAPAANGAAVDSVIPLRDVVANLTPEGLQLAADWGSLVGAGAVAAGGFLALGLLLRPVVFVLLGFMGYGFMSGLEQSALPANAPAMFVLAAACSSLLVSGPGCLALRRRRRRPSSRGQSGSAQQSHEDRQPRQHAAQVSEFVQRKDPTFGQRVKGAFKKLPGLRGKRRRHKPRYEPAPMRAAAKRWRFWQLRGN